MEKIYEKADDQHVAANIVYGKITDDGHGETTKELFANSEFTEYLDEQEVNDAYINGTLFVTSTNIGLLRPLAAVTFEEGEFGYLTVNSSASPSSLGYDIWHVAADPEAGN